MAFYKHKTQNTAQKEYKARYVRCSAAKSFRVIIDDEGDITIKNQKTKNSGARVSLIR